jgi:hypothetical protein
MTPDHALWFIPVGLGWAWLVVGVTSGEWRVWRWRE